MCLNFSLNMLIKKRFLSSFFFFTFLKVRWSSSLNLSKPKIIICFKNNLNYSRKEQVASLFLFFTFTCFYFFFVNSINSIIKKYYSFDFVSNYALFVIRERKKKRQKNSMHQIQIIRTKECFQQLNKENKTAWENPLS